MTSIRLGAGAEFDRIRALAAALGPTAAALGDDCAVVPEGEGELLVSIDTSVEGVHFRREWLAPDEIGWRAAAAALSDLAAHGAGPVGLLCAVGVPGGTETAHVVALMSGVGKAAASVGALVLGGDLSAASEWTVTVSVIGRAPRPVPRTGAEPGDGVWVTGALGSARAALDAWRTGRTPTPGARTAFARPEPRVAAGAWLAAHGAKAMLDLSDGIGSDAAHLAAASGVRVDVDLELVPVSGDAATAAVAAGTDPALYAAAGGEDYELLVVLPPHFGSPEQVAFERDCGLGLTRVGSVHLGSGLRTRYRGEPVTLEGFDHFG